MKTDLLIGAMSLGLVLGCGGSTAGNGPATDSGAPGADSDTFDSGMPPEAGEGAPPSEAGVMPINAPNDTWTWVDFPDAHCGDGSMTGIGVNPHAGATRMLIFMMGGGACFDAQSCWINPTASNMTGYNGTNFANEQVVKLGPPFNRAYSGNPFKDAIMVFVPYCTGDVHVGTKIANYVVNGMPKPTYHYGAHNLDLELASLAASYKGLDRVWLSGVSAGGYGVILNLDSTVKAFGGIRVDSIDDSGPAIELPIGVPTSWGPRLPPGCGTCQGLSDVFKYDRMTYAQWKYGFLTYQTDTTLPMFYGETPAQFSTKIASFIQSFSGDANAKSFMALSSGHVVLADIAVLNYSMAWLTKLATDDPTWASEMH
jgi:hypothetical protein